MVPAKRSSGAKHEVKEFDSIEDAISAYLRNINTGDAYQNLRQIRARLRNTGKHPDGRALADGLLYYSQRREAYVNEVKKMLQQYHQFKQQQQ
jgi:Bax protein